MANDKISNFTAAVGGDLAGTTTRIEVSKTWDTAPSTLGSTLALLRTTMFAGGTGYTATDPLTCGAISTSGDFAIATSKFTVASASGNTVIAGTASVTGDFAIATSKFTVAAASGNTVVAGNIAVGTAIAVGVGIFGRAAALTGVNQYGLNVIPTVSSAATTTATGGLFAIATAAASFTVANGRGILIDLPSIGAGSAITELAGIRILNQGASGVANAIGLDIAAQSGAATLNIGFRNAGTTLLVGTATLSSLAGVGTRAVVADANGVLSAP